MKKQATLLVCAALLILACERKTQTREPARQEEEASTSYEVEFPSTEGECTPPDATMARAWISAWQLWRGAGPDADDIDAVTLDTTRLSEEPRLTIQVHRETMSAGSRPLTLDGIRDRVRELEQGRLREAKLLGRSASELPMTIGLAIGPDVTGARVLEVLRHVPADQDTELSFVFEAPPLPANVQPVPPELLTRIKALTSRREDEVLLDFSKLNDATLEATAGCSAYQSFFDSMELAGPEEQDNVVRDGLVEAWMECDCKGDLAFLVARFVVLPTGATAPITAIEVDPDPNAEPLELPSDAVWSKIAPTLVSRDEDSVCIPGAPTAEHSELICTARNEPGSSSPEVARDQPASEKQHEQGSDE